MANQRRRSSPLSRASSASYDESPERRQTSVRLSRDGSSGRAARGSSGRSGASNSSMRLVATTSRARTRRPTPIVRRDRKVSIAADLSPASTPSDSGSQVSSEGERSEPVDEERRKAGSSKRSMRFDVDTSSGGHRNRGNQQRTLRVSASRSADRSAGAAAWYERLLPECVLSMTAPLTGYEDRLEQSLDEELLDDHELEILERQRLRRNKRVKRRLLTIMLLATAAGLIMYTRGRFFRKVGVKAAISSVKHRLEDGLAKTIHDTMGK